MEPSANEIKPSILEDAKGSTKKRDWRIFIASVFFVLGFSSIFSLLGVLLQTVLASVAPELQIWLSRIGGVLVITFGIYLLDLISISFLEQEHKFRLTKRFNSMYLTSFLFGAVFAVGWTPCVGPVLGAILTLAVTQPSMAFFFLLSYTLGLGLPFLLVGLFTNQAQNTIRKIGKWLRYFRYVFGVILIGIGVLVFTNQLSRVAGFAYASSFLASLGTDSIALGASLNIIIAFLAGIVSFLSPCVLPLIPAFLTYLASVGVNVADGSRSK